MGGPARAARGGRGSGGGWRDLRARLLTAAVAAPIGLLCLWAGGVPWLVLVLAASCGLAWEWLGLCRTRLASPPGTLFGAGIVLGIGMWVIEGQGLILALLPVLLAGAFLIAGYRDRRGGELAAGAVCIVLAALSLIWLRRGEADMLLLVLLTVWASDSFAYLVGRWLGGPKLAPSISPGKTRSGAAGGLLGAMAIAGLLAAVLPPTALTPSVHALLRLGIGLALGAGFGLVAQAGDLAESAFKRRAGAKDSGRLLPGHGGLLDRLDGLLAAAPAAVVAVFVVAALHDAVFATPNPSPPASAPLASR